MNEILATGMFRLVFGFCARQWRRQPGRIGAMMACMLVAAMIEAVTPLLFGRLVDAIAGAALQMAVTLVLLVIGIGVLLLLVRYINIVQLTTSTLTVMQSMVEEGFHRVQRFSTDWHASTFGGATVRAITRGVWGYDALGDSLILGFFPAIVLLVAVTGLLTWHWPAMGAAVGIGVILYLALAVSMTLIYITPAARRSNAFDSKLSGTLADAITCNPVVKAFAAEGREETRLSEVTRQWYRLVRTSWLRYALTNIGQSFIALAMQAGILAIGLWLWRAGRATPGDIAYLVTTFTLLQGYLREVANHFRSLLRAVSDLEELARFSQLPLGIMDADGAGQIKVGAGRITFDCVEFRYPNALLPLYRDFSLDIPAGCRVGLVGASGSGKSSFVKLIQRLYDVESGRILIDGQDIALVTQRSLRSSVAVVPQDPVLFHRSIAENIAYARPDAPLAEIIAAARRAHAHEFIETLPQGYDTLVGERGIKLSGGERQRIALARAVLSEARILIFDEATSSLDSVSEHLLQQAMEDVMEGRTTIIIAHRLSTVQRVDRILLFDHGCIMEQGSHRQLLAKTDGLYRRLFATQVLGLIGQDEIAAS